jgi:hypothetical protein
MVIFPGELTTMAGRRMRLVVYLEFGLNLSMTNGS